MIVNRSMFQILGIASRSVEVPAEHLRLLPQVVAVMGQRLEPGGPGFPKLGRPAGIARVVDVKVRLAVGADDAVEAG